MKNIFLEWYDCDNVLNQFGSDVTQDKKTSFELRIYQTTKKITSLDTMIDKVIEAVDLFVAEEKGTVEKVLIGLLLVLSVSPFKFKILEGKGIDNIIDSVKLDAETGDIYIDKKIFDSICIYDSIKKDTINWFAENDLLEIKKDRILFNRSTLKSGKIYQKI
jgi:hypothetical protein